MKSDRSSDVDDTVATLDEGTPARKHGSTTSDAPTQVGDVLPSRPGGAIGEDGLIVGRYRVEATIGLGGMGEIVSARDEQIGRSVAIKRLRIAQPSPDATARFLREAQIQGRLEHPAVVPVHEMCRDLHGEPFFVMKQLTGVTLADVLADRAPANQAFTRLRLLRAFAEVCLAVEFAHTRGVIHRDLKPANIMLGDFGEVYVLDWGIARIDDEVVRHSFADVDTLDLGGTLEGTTLGTPGYMSAEQVRGDADLDRRADVYALGCILFEILAGTPLHPRGLAGLASALGGVEEQPSSRAPERSIPPELDAVCLAATKLDRRDRTSSARELGDAVQRYLDGDRDVALRRDLARSELETAHLALAQDDRRAAIRSAARALALDPAAREPAELVGKLMMEPPAEVPHEVEAELEAIAVRALRAHSALGARAMAACMAFFPVLYWAGFRDPWFLVAGPLLAATIMVFTKIFVHRPVAWLVPATIVASALLIAVFSRIGTPFFVAPALGVVIGMLYAMHVTSARPWVLWAVMITAVLGPLVLELGGVLSATTFVIDDVVVLRTGAAHLDKLIALPAMVIYVAVMLAISIGMSRVQARNQRAAQRMVQIQAWQLRQLVPRAETAPAVRGLAA